MEARTLRGWKRPSVVFLMMIGAIGCTDVKRGPCPPAEDLKFIEDLVRFKKRLYNDTTGITVKGELAQLRRLTYHSIFWTAGLYNFQDTAWLNDLALEINVFGPDSEEYFIAAMSDASQAAIPVEWASAWHLHYLDTKPYYNTALTSEDVPDQTRAVYYNMSHIIPMGLIPWDGATWENLGMYTYLSKYDGMEELPEEKHQQSSTIAHFVIAGEGEEEMMGIEGAIYNLGNLCPPRCPMPDPLPTTRAE